MPENFDKNWIGENAKEDELYKENILDHYRNPRNFGTLKNYTMKLSKFNPSCGDQIEIFLNIEHNKVKDISFNAKGCAISVASASMFTEKIKGIALEELPNVKEKDVLEQIGIELGVVRRKCALLPLRAIIDNPQKTGVKNEQIDNP